MELEVFNNSEFGEIRTIVIENVPYFCMGDICKSLDIGNVSQAKTRLKEDGIITNEVMDSIGRRQKVIFVNESNMYRLIFQSRKESAERFTDWVTSEVLPQIRKTGSYSENKKSALPSDYLTALKALVASEEEKQRLSASNQQLNKEVSIKNQIISELKPKADYTDIILKSKSTVTTTQIAKDYGMSANGMNKILHDLHIQYKQSGQWLLYGKYAKNGYTHSETVYIERSNGLKDVKMNTKWTQKGRLFLYNTLKDNGYLPMIERD